MAAFTVALVLAIVILTLYLTLRKRPTPLEQQPLRPTTLVVRL